MKNKFLNIFSLLILFSCLSPKAYSSPGDKIGNGINISSSFFSDSSSSTNMTMNDNGNYVVTWVSNNLIYTRRFDAGNTEIGSISQGFNGSSPKTGIDSAGNYVISWLDITSNDYRLFFSIFDSLGNELKSATNIISYLFNASSSSQQVIGVHDITVSNSGDFRLIWHRTNTGLSNPGWTEDALFQSFDSLGTATGNQKTAISVLSSQNYISQPDIETLNNNFIVVLPGSTDQVTGILMQRFDNSEINIDNIRLVNTSTATGVHNPNVSANSKGDYIVTWEYRRNFNNQLYDIKAQRFDSTGTPVGNEIQINTSDIESFNNYLNPKAAIDESGNFVITWGGVYQNNSFQSILMRLYDSSGNPITGEILVGPEEANNSSVAVHDNGNIVVVWDEGQVYAQSFEGFSTSTSNNGNSSSGGGITFLLLSLFFLPLRLLSVLSLE